MESCPHCNFLVPDGARTCGVCHRPTTGDAVASALAAPGMAQARVAPPHGGSSVAVVALMLLLLLFGAGAGVAAMTWP